MISTTHTAHKGCQHEAGGAKGSVQRLARDKVGGGFARGDEWEDVSVAVVIGPVCMLFEGGRPRGVGRGGSIVQSGSESKQWAC